MCYKLLNEKRLTLKEYAIALAKHQLQYTDFWVFHDISFEVEKGDIVGIIGKNGAGKSTLLKIISGVLEATEGNVTVNGNIVPMLELGSGFDFELTGRENIFLNGAILGYSESFLKEKYDEIVEFSELGDFIERPIRNYSSGMVARLAFAIATVVQPEILIVDEILGVGDEAFQKKSKRKMLSMMDGGCTVLFVSHSIGQIREMCNKVLWLEDGKMRMFGDAKKVCDAYQEFLNPSGQLDDLSQAKFVNRVRDYSKDVLYIYGDRNINNYIWRVAVGREQLLATGTSTGEVFLDNLTDDLIDKYDNFIFSKCSYSDTIKSFIEKAKGKNKSCYIDVTSKSDECISIYDSLKDMLDGIIIPDDSLKSMFADDDNVLSNPYVVLDRIAQVSSWAVYDRDVLPTVDNEKIDSEQALINYNKAMLEKKKRDDKYTRFVFVQLGEDDDLYADALKALVKYVSNKENYKIIIKYKGIKKHNLEEYSEIIEEEPFDSFEEIPKLYTLADYVVRPKMNDGFDEENAIQEAMANMVKVPFILFDHVNGTLEEPSGDLEEKYKLEKSRTTLLTGYQYKNFVKGNDRKVVGIVIKDTDDISPQLAQYIEELVAKGHIIHFLSKKITDEVITVNNNDYLVINTDKIYFETTFNALIAVGWENYEYIKKYENVVERYLYVSTIDEDEFEEGDFNRFKRSMAFSSTSSVRYIAEDEQISKLINEKYGISTERMSAVLA